MRRSIGEKISWAGAGAALFALAGCSSCLSWFGPPEVEMKEAYAERGAGKTFDHSLLDAVLKQHVGPDGLVDYAALSGDSTKLDRYIAALGRADFDGLGRDEKLALLINAYNAFTLRLILDHWQGGALESIRDIPSGKRWKAVRWRVGPHRWSLDQIEHEQIRPRFREPRIHFAVVCAAKGCPPLRAEAYVGSRLEAQLADQTRHVHTHERWLRYDPQSNTLRLTRLYQWFAGDFEQLAGSVLGYVAGQVPGVAAALERGQGPEIEWLDYDWRLNASRQNRGASWGRRRRKICRSAERGSPPCRNY